MASACSYLARYLTISVLMADLLDVRVEGLKLAGITSTSGFTPHTSDYGGGNYSTAWDGDITTYFDANSGGGDGKWTQGNFDSAIVVCIKFWPRISYEGRMANGTFWGVRGGGLAAVLLGTITSIPLYSWTSMNVSTDEALIGVKYSSPNGGYGNVAEIQVYTKEAATTQYDPRLTSYHDSGACGPMGDDYQSQWCGGVNEVSPNCSATQSVSADICPSGWADLVSVQGDGTCCFSVNINGCSYAYFAQYSCQQAACSGDFAATDANLHGVSVISGHVDFVDSLGAFIEWHLTGCSEGAYGVDFTYALGSGQQDRPLQLLVNGASVVSSLSFPDTGSWNTWSTLTHEEVSLNTGSNTIKLLAIGESGGNFLKLTLTQAKSWVMVHDTTQGYLGCPHLHGEDHGFSSNCPNYANPQACQLDCLFQVPGCNGLNFKPSTGTCCFKRCEDPFAPVFHTGTGYEVYLYRVETKTTSILTESRTTTSTMPAVVLYGEMTIRVTQARDFVEEANLLVTLEEFIATIFEIPVSWVHSVSVSLNSNRSLSSSADEKVNGRSLSESASVEDVHVSWRIIFPPNAPNSITAIVLLDKANSMSVAYATKEIQSLINAGDFGNPYEVSVNWIFLEPAGSPTQGGADLVREDSNNDMTLPIILTSATIIACIGVCIGVQWIVKPCGRREDFQAATSRDEFLLLGGPFASRTFLELLHPPEAISETVAADIRRLARAMVHYDDKGVQVFLTYALGHRPQDGRRCGPGMFFAAAVLRILYDNDIKCLCNLMFPDDDPEDVIAARLSASCSKCETLLVLQTKALYENHHPLKEIFIAQRQNIQVIPLRCEDELPSQDTQWPNICSENLDHVLMLTEVQAKFGTFNSIPSPPYTVAQKPSVLTDLCIDLRLKLRLPARVSCHNAIFAEPEPKSTSSTSLIKALDLDSARTSNPNCSSIYDSAEQQATYEGCRKIGKELSHLQEPFAFSGAPTIAEIKSETEDFMPCPSHERSKRKKPRHRRSPNLEYGESKSKYWLRTEDSVPKSARKKKDHPSSKNAENGHVLCLSSREDQMSSPRTNSSRQKLGPTQGRLQPCVLKREAPDQIHRLAMRLRRQYKRQCAER